MGAPRMLLDERVLVCAPTGRDASLICESLTENGLPAEHLVRMSEITAAMAEGAAVAIIADETLNGDSIVQFTAELAAQPKWSDFPVIILTSSTEAADLNWRLAEAIQEIRHFTLLERPLRQVTLLSAVRVALQSRRRQYQLRDELARRDDTERALRKSITERKEAERELSKLAAIVESSQDAIVGNDLDGTITSWNEGAERMYGYRAEEVIGRHVSMLVPPDQLAELERIMEEARCGRGGQPVETVRLTREGRHIEVSLTTSPVRDEAGRIIATSAIARDITSQKHAEKHQQLLLAELQHRVKNTLMAVLNIAAQTRRRADSLEDFSESYEGRLQALARAHSLLTRSNWKSASLRELAEQTFAPYRTAEMHHVWIEGSDVALTPRAALALGMILHELATNAVKYGALSVASGRVDLCWRIEEDEGPPRFRLYWQESGGPPVTPPPHKGFGSELIERSISYELSGEAELHYCESGLRCVLQCPVNGQVFQSSVHEKDLHYDAELQR